MRNRWVQALAILQAEKESGRAAHPSLVVAPTSVVQNWADEAGRFVPFKKRSLHDCPPFGARRRP